MNYDADVLKFKHPFTFCIVGPTGCGKTVFVKNLLKVYKEKIYPVPQKILYFFQYGNPCIQIF